MPSWNKTAIAFAFSTRSAIVSMSRSAAAFASACPVAWSLTALGLGLVVAIFIQVQYVEFCHRLLESGAAGLAVFGTTSEGNSLSIDERKSLLDALHRSGVPGATLMPGIGACSVTETAEMLIHADRVGSAGTLMLPPFYYKNAMASDDGLFDFVAEVMRRTQGATTKVYLYHIPPVATVGWSHELVGRLMDAFPDRIVGLKDSTGDWDNTKRLIESYRDRGLDVFPGSEVFLLDALRIGGAGCITATGNLNPGGVSSVYSARERNDADALQEKATKVRMAVQETGPPITVMKAYLAYKTGDEDWANVRPPLRSNNRDVAAALDHRLTELEFDFALV